MDAKEFAAEFETLSPDSRLSSLVSILVGPQGCAWDQKQTSLSVLDHLIDEAHELKSALLSGKKEEISGELGDLLFTVSFLKERIDREHSLEHATLQLVEKMIRRHPHVFGNTDFPTEEALKRNWEAEKYKENSSRKRYDEDIPSSLPPLRKATKILSRMMNAGFSYQTLEQALDKVWEEVLELEGALESEHFSDELGDVLVSLLTLSKMKQCSPEQSLERSLKKLCDRLETLERQSGRPIHEIPREELAPLYRASKETSQPGRVFFNYCGVSPWPRPVRLAIRKATQELATRGLPAALELLQEREKLAPLIQQFCRAAPTSKVVLVPNVSTAALGVAYAQAWNRGDKVLLGKNEFPANTVPWRVACDTFDLEAVWFDDDLLRTNPELGWHHLEQTMAQSRPKILAISAVSFWSGYRVDLQRLAELCRKHEVRLYVDAIQALGNTPTSCLDSIAYFAGGSHKALLAPEGAGFLIVSEEASRDWKPRLASWLSLSDPVGFLGSGQPKSLRYDSVLRTQDPTTLQGSSLNSVGYVGLQASLRYLSDFDLELEFQKILELQNPLEEFLTARGWQSLRADSPSHRSAILSFAPPAGTDLVGLQSALSQAGIEVGIPNGVLRFGFHVFHNNTEVKKVIDYFRAC